MAHLEVESTARIYLEHHPGAGRPVVLVHGWGVSARCWDTVAPALRAAGHPVTLVDLRCCGRADNDFADVSIAAMGADVARVCQELGLERPVINGWSLGGAVAVDAAARLGQELGGLVLTGGATPRYTAVDDWPHGSSVDDVEGILAGLAADRATTLQGVAGAVCAAPVGQAVVDWMWGMFLEMGPRGDESLRDLADIDQRDLLAKIEAPTLLLHGRQDGFVPFSNAEAAVDLLPDGRLVAFDASGHATFLEERDRYLSELMPFVER